MKKSTDQLIFVAVRGCSVRGYDPETIVAFEKEWLSEAKPYGIGYWDWFNISKVTEMDGYEAFAYSTLWRMEAAYTELDRLRRLNNIRI